VLCRKSVHINNSRAVNNEGSKIELATYDRVHKESDDAIASALEEGKELLKKAASYAFVSKIHG
jgi:hypothetical protein